MTILCCLVCELFLTTVSENIESTGSVEETFQTTWSCPVMKLDMVRSVEGGGGPVEYQKQREL